MVIIAVTLAVILGASSMVVESQDNQYYLYSQKSYFWINDTPKLYKLKKIDKRNGLILTKRNGIIDPDTVRSINVIRNETQASLHNTKKGRTLTTLTYLPFLVGTGHMISTIGNNFVFKGMPYGALATVAAQTILFGAYKRKEVVQIREVNSIFRVTETRINGYGYDRSDYTININPKKAKKIAKEEKKKAKKEAKKARTRQEKG